MKWLFVLLLLSGLVLSGCGSGPADVSRTESPYLHTNVMDEIRYLHEPNYGRRSETSDMNSADPLRITNKEEMRSVAFWLNETFHNREAHTSQDPDFFKGDQSHATSGLLQISTVNGPVEVQVWLNGEYEAQNHYTENRVFRSAWQTAIDDRYPDEQFYYVNQVVVKYRGYYYRTYFFPKILASPDINKK